MYSCVMAERVHVHRMRGYDCCSLDNVSDVFLHRWTQVASQQGAYLGRLFSRGYLHTPSYTPSKQTSGGHFDLDRANVANSASSLGAFSVRSLMQRPPPSKLASTLPSASSSISSTASSTSTRDIVFVSETYNFGSLGVPTVLPSPTATATATTAASQPLAISSVSTSVYVAKPFQFLNLGVLAYLGGAQALAQINILDNTNDARSSKRENKGKNSKVKNSDSNTSDTTRSSSTAHTSGSSDDDDDENEIEEKDVSLKSAGPLGFLLWRGIYWFKQVGCGIRLCISL